MHLTVEQQPYQNLQQVYNTTTIINIIVQQFAILFLIYQAADDDEHISDHDDIGGTKGELVCSCLAHLKPAFLMSLPFIGNSPFSFCKLRPRNNIVEQLAQHLINTHSEYLSFTCKSVVCDQAVAFNLQQIAIVIYLA
uniref:Uncharacterized protein n=1 Tax=Glossina brevipalpis TaxID=37001 RepID=A0A1A9WRJ8_9MUSC